MKISTQLRMMWFLSSLPIMGLLLTVYGVSIVNCFIGLPAVLTMFVAMAYCDRFWKKTDSWLMRGVLFFSLFSLALSVPIYFFVSVVGGGSMAVVEGVVSARSLHSQVLFVTLGSAAAVGCVWTLVVITLMKWWTRSEKNAVRGISFTACLLFGTAILSHPRTPANFSDSELVQYVDLELPKVKYTKVSPDVGGHRGQRLYIKFLCFESRCSEGSKKIVAYSIPSEDCKKNSGVVREFETIVFDRSELREYCVPSVVEKKF